MKSRLKNLSLIFWPYLLIILITSFIMWPQSSSRSLFLGADSIFHMNQFYETAMQIKTGHLSWFLTLFGFDQTGRITDALYGPIFSYLMGLALLILGNWARFEFWFSFISIALAGGLMTWLGNRLHFGQIISTLLGIIYMCSLPVFDIVTNQSFDSLGFVILPVAVWIGIKMWREKRVPVVSLAILMAVVAQIHLLTVIIFSITLVPFAIVSWCESHRKSRWILQAVSAVSLTLLLTGDVWGSILEVLTTNNTVPPFPNRYMESPEFAVQWTHHQLAILGNVWLWIGLLSLILIGIHIIWVRINYRRLDHLTCFTLLMSFAFFILSSAYFPWYNLVHYVPIIRQTLQFPRRFAGVFVIFALLTLGRESSIFFHNHSEIHVVAWLGIVGIIMIACLMTIIEHRSVEQNDAIWHSKTMVTAYIIHPKMPLNQIHETAFDHNLGLAPHVFIKSVPDYLPSNHRIYYGNFYQVHPYGKNFRKVMNMKIKRYRVMHPKHQTNKPIYWDAAAHKDNPLDFRKSIQGRDTEVVTWHQPARLANQTIRIPVVKYAHTQITLNSQPLCHVPIDWIGAMNLKSPAGHNQLTLHYQPSQSWQVVMILTVISWLALLLGIILY